MPARECVGAAKCPYGEECFAEAARERARSVDIVVTNHSLLAIDMLAERHILPPHKLLVVDEAHELADRVSASAQAELTTEAVDRAARRARRLVEPDVSERSPKPATRWRSGWATPGRPVDWPPAPALHSACTLLDAATRRRADRIGEVKADDPEAVAKQPARAALDALSTTAQRLLAADETTWHGSRSPNSAGAGERLVVAPLSVARPPRRPPLPRAHRGGDLGHAHPRRHVRHRGPLARVPPPAATGQSAWQLRSTSAPRSTTPRQGILYVAAHLPRHGSQACRSLSRGVGTTRPALGGRTLGLFSSRRAAHAPPRCCGSRPT